MLNTNDAPVQLNRLYEEFFERGLQYFFPSNSRRATKPSNHRAIPVAFS